MSGKIEQKHGMAKFVHQNLNVKFLRQKHASKIWPRRAVGWQSLAVGMGVGVGVSNSEQPFFVSFLCGLF